MNQDEYSNLMSNRIEKLIPPPRRVPIATQCAALVGFLGLFGAIFFSFGMVFVWAFGLNMHPIDNWRLSNESETTFGVIEEATFTNSTVNEVPVFRYRFRYQPGDGPALVAECYTIGKQWSAGNKAEVQYLPGNPEVACLKGASISMFPIWVMALVIIFPLVGLGLLLPSLISGWGKIKLLRFGVVTGAKKLFANATNMKVNNVPVMKFSYEFQDNLGMVYTGSSKTTGMGYIGDEAVEPVLYLPSNPKKSTLVDALPIEFPLEVDQSGQWLDKNGFKSILTAGISFILIFVHVVIALLIYL